jgi:hypothetical protein
MLFEKPGSDYTTITLVVNRWHCFGLKAVWRLGGGRRFIATTLETLRMSKVKTLYSQCLGAMKLSVGRLFGLILPTCKHTSGLINPLWMELRITSSW